MTTPEPIPAVSRTLLDRVLELFPDTPKKRAKQWILNGRVRVNGDVIRQPHHVLQAAGDKVTLLDRHASVVDCGPGGWRIHPRVIVLHLDTSLAVVNKGPGLLAVPSVAGELSALSVLADFLVGKLPAQDRRIGGQALPPSYRQLHPLPVHRLDQYTSGVFCMAMNPVARRKLIEQLKLHTMSREYIAYVDGRPSQPKGTWRNWLSGGKDDLRQAVVSDAVAKAKPDDVMKAVTHYEVIQEYPIGRGKRYVTKLRLRLETGRKHQIRVQAAHAGLPLLGDRTYHPRYRDEHDTAPRIEFPRQALHAETLGLEHPDRPGTRLTWTAALPKDLQILEADLRRGWV